MEIAITPNELKQEKLTNAHLSQAVKAIREDGFVILADVIQHDHLDIVRERMLEDSMKLIEAEKWGGAGQLKGHLQQGPPPFAPYVFRDIAANPFAIQVTTTILGKGAYNRFYNGNTNCPGSEQQPLHRDGSPLWPNLPIAHPSCTLIINISPIGVSAENGATELWPGTHLETTVEGRVDAEAEARQRDICPPIQPAVRKGSLLIRDNRLWHRGVPNRSDTIRHMIALIHNVNWLQKPFTLLFNQGCEEAFADDGFDHNVEFTAEPLEYLLTRAPTPVKDLG
jgi:ectoine hydroxylase-related dioxygenase (phytanoyl-CoA dioxygenase family)